MRTIISRDATIVIFEKHVQSLFERTPFQFAIISPKQQQAFKTQRIPANRFMSCDQCGSPKALKQLMPAEPPP